MNGYCNTNTFATAFPTTKGHDQPSFSAITSHGHPASIFLMSNMTRTDRRYIHSETTAESSSQPAETNDSSVQQTPSLERRTKSDPTAKRPTPKCDPYGLQGESLSHAQCLDWMSTLEDGWMLRRQSEKDDTVVDTTTVEDNTTNDATAIIEQAPPKFLQKYHYHSTFHEASQFLTQISLLATNINHFPFLSMERLLVDDVNNIHGDKRNEKNWSVDGTSIVSETNINNDGNSSTTTKRKKRKIKGWIFRSTIRCSTYRPPTAGSSNSRGSSQKDEKIELHTDKGLTYHDFHLAMMIDVEVNREEVKRLLWSDVSQD